MRKLTGFCTAFFIFWGSFANPVGLRADPSSGSLHSLLGTMNSLDSFRSNITINGSLSGTLSYKKPGQIHVKLSDGRVIAANGKTLWFYSPERAVTGKQDLKGFTGGIQDLVSGYQESVKGKTIRLKSESKKYSEITIVLDTNNLPKSIRLQGKDANPVEIYFSGITTNLGLSANLFNYQPPTTSIIVENPLNQKE